MPFLLMVFLVLVCLPEADAWLKVNPLRWPSPWQAAALTWLAVLLVGLHAWWVARGVSGSLGEEPTLRERLLRRYERRRSYQQIGLFVAYVAVLLLGWGWAVARLWHGRTAPLPGTELLVLAPFVVAQLLSWAAYYDAERAVHQAAYRPPAAEPHAGAWLELEPTRGAPAAFGSRGSYVLFQLRQKLALVFLPVFLLLVQRELARAFPELWRDWQKAVNFLGIASVLVVFAAMPWIVRLILGLRPLPPGPLRDRLEASARRLRFRYSNILVWDTRSGMANAMVIGILPWVRYVIFTDRLLEDFTADEVEAVFGHEVGHIRHHHMAYYFTFLTVSVVVLGWLVNDVFLYWWGPVDLQDQQWQWVSAGVVVLALLAYVFVVFGYLSRRCERQADLFGCRAVSCPDPDCRGHLEALDPARRDVGLCATGICTFIRALEKVARVNGISRDRPGFLQSWQHSTIGRRVAFLQGVLLDRGAERRFQRRVFVFKWALLLLLGGALTALLVRESQLPPEGGERTGTPVRVEESSL